MNETFWVNGSNIIFAFDPTPLSEAVNLSIPTISLEISGKPFQSIEILLFSILCVLFLWMVMWIWMKWRNYKK